MNARFSIPAVRSEGAMLRHLFTQESHKNRPDIIVHVHDVANCGLCALLETVEAAKAVAPFLPPLHRAALNRYLARFTGEGT